MIARSQRSAEELLGDKIFREGIGHSTYFFLMSRSGNNDNNSGEALKGVAEAFFFFYSALATLENMDEPGSAQRKYLRQSLP